MASTGSVAVFGFGAATAATAARRTGSQAGFAFGATTGVFDGGGGLTYSRQRDQDWLPSERQPFGYLGGDRNKPVYLDVVWYRFFRHLAQVSLGGLTAPTVPDVSMNVVGAKGAATVAQQQAAVGYQSARIVADAVNYLQNVVGRPDSENVAKTLDPVVLPAFPGGG